MYDKERKLSSKQASKQASKQYNSIDLMKLIMAIVVIAIHTEPLVRCEKIAVLNLYKAISDVAVPFFFFSIWFFGV